MDIKFLDNLEIDNKGNLVGKILAATSNLNDSIFEKALVFICAHDSHGTIGIVFNKSTPITKSKKIFSKYKIRKNIIESNKYKMLSGGPIDEDKLFILSFDQDNEDINQNKKLILYTNAEVFLLDVFNGSNESNFIICNGLCGWGPKQLEEEIEENSWIVTNHDFRIIFEDMPSKKWSKVIKKLGIKNLERLVSYNGNA